MNLLCVYFIYRLIFVYNPFTKNETDCPVGQHFRQLHIIHVDGMNVTN